MIGEVVSVTVRVKLPEGVSRAFQPDQLYAVRAEAFQCHDRVLIHH